jgi:hypothetical protein
LAYEEPAGGAQPEHYIFKSEVTVDAATVDATTPTPPQVDPSDGGSVTGKVDPSEVEDEDLWVVVTDPETGEELCRSQVAADGTFTCELVPPLEDGKSIVINVVDEAGNSSDKVDLVTDSTPPAKPWIDPSDGGQMTGKGEPGDTITITDEGGKEICRTTVGADGTWQCTFSPKANEGDIIHIIETDSSGNASREIDWRVGQPRMELAVNELQVGDAQAATGYNFQPGEVVTATQFSDPYLVGSAKADRNGTVRFAYRIPQGTPAATHRLELSGASSGKVSAEFVVVAGTGPDGEAQGTGSSGQLSSGSGSGQLPFTGAADLLGMAGAAFGALLAGLFFLVAARRRRQGEDAEA